LDDFFGDEHAQYVRERYFIQSRYWLLERLERY